MPKQLRVGIAGIRHSHTPTLVRQWGEIEDAEVVAAADSFPSARALASDAWGIPAIYETWDAMFEAEELDVVTSTLPNTQHADIVEACAERGLPVLIEKPMASSLADADRMVQAAEAAGIPALINWPTLGQTAFETGAKLVADGAIGTPRQYVFRGGNPIATRKAEQPDWFQWLFDAAQGGGSWIDYAGYGAAPCLLWMGRPRRLVARDASVTERNARADESAAAVLEFPRGLGTIQTSHVQVGYPGPQGTMLHIEVSGETGVLVMTPGGDGVELRIYDGDSRRAGEVIETPPAASERRSGVAYFAHCVREGLPIEGRGSFRFNREVVAIIDAGVRALTTGASVAVPPALDG